MNKFTKFLKNKNTVTILGVLACLVILWAAYNMRINQQTKLVDVFFAKETIQPKTLITEEMIGKMSVPQSFIKGNYYKSYDQILGKYSNYNSVIAEGSLFYTDLLVEEATLPDAMLHDINEGEKLFSFPVNIETTYGNSIMPSNVVDIYAKMYDDNGKLVYGRLMENIEILAVKDSSGQNVFEVSDTTRTPAFTYFSLPEGQYLLLSSLKYLKDTMVMNDIEIVLVPNTEKFDAENPNATEVSSEYFYNYVIDKIEQIDDQGETYTELINEIKQYNLEKQNAKNADSEEETED